MASISTCFTITPKFHSKTFKYSVNHLLHNTCTKLGTPNGSSSSRNRSRSFVVEIRAKFDTPPVEATARVRPGRIIESDKLPAEVRKRTMEAVDKCGRRVTVGDVASKAGIKLTEAQRALQALAADTNGFLE
ncbi:hypothetical protein HanOQP8_Chr01g0012951 [Helianthus annuus]|nr:hypothetical protein HanOQP8_Chr01g0012951 [Helianthus annuus]